MPIAEDGSYVPASFYDTDQGRVGGAPPPGYTMAEDGSIVPLSFYGGRGGGGGDGSMEGAARALNAMADELEQGGGGGGYTTAEDGSRVPTSFYGGGDPYRLVPTGGGTYKTASGRKIPGYPEQDPMDT